MVGYQTIVLSLSALSAASDPTTPFFSAAVNLTEIFV
jgi:hypothetical protein